MILGIPTETGVRVGGAVAIGAVLIGGVLLLEHRAPAQSAPVAAVAVAGKSDDVRETRPTLDSDGDGYPDWEEELRGTDPRAYTTVEVPTTTAADDAYEPPTTLTGQFAEEFLEDFIRTSAGRELTAEEQAEFVEQSVGQVIAQTADEFYTRADLLIVSDSNVIDLHAYGNAVANALAENSIGNEPELDILNRAVASDDPSTLDALDPIAAAYSGMVTDLLALPVPRTLAKEHLDLINALSAIETDIRAMRITFDDPLASLVRVQRYPDDALGLVYALDNIRTALEVRGVAYTSNEAGVFLFSLRP